MMIRGLCFGGAVLVLVGAASGGCSSDSSGSSSSGSSGTSSGTSGTSGTSGASSGTSGTSSGTSGTSSGTSGASSGTSGASSGSSGASSGSSGDAGQDSGKAVSCTTYCTTVNSNCTAGNIDYMTATNAADCTKACGFLAKGTYADTTNSVGCRQYHSDLAAGTGAMTHCPHAGMFGGGGTCGEKCDDFCTVAVGACPTTYANKAECVTACGGWAVDANKPIGPAWTGTPSGITGVASEAYNCRAYHLSAALSAPATHCPHIGATSATCK